MAILAPEYIGLESNQSMYYTYYYHIVYASGERERIKWPQLIGIQLLFWHFFDAQMEYQWVMSSSIVRNFLRERYINIFHQKINDRKNIEETNLEQSRGPTAQWSGNKKCEAEWNEREENQLIIVIMATWIVVSESGSASWEIDWFMCSSFEVTF